MATLAQQTISRAASGVAGLRRGLAPPSHVILILFSAIILLPLLWVLRVSLTDKLTAYRIPPEWTTPSFDNYVEIFTAYPFATWFLNSVIVALGSTAIACRSRWRSPMPSPASIPAAGRSGWACSPARMLPVILVLPLFALFLGAGLLNTRVGLIIAHLTFNLPFLAWMLIAFFEGEVRQLEEAARSRARRAFRRSCGSRYQWPRPAFWRPGCSASSSAGTSSCSR